ncbi:dTDP-4-dehydrorhamnose 3,5-epimerase family protein (plasmid) [Chimaeribacter arupi]|uniref:dTDP-4-dehydrorhamnose 3,5-epimerase family protein n=1 Tax=Chimaeribacter arupi TaxID=2060066 RepID=UPI002711F150|nr:dTDP-4-dehydrorhamnose 3,5-epimerase family protein [Chimaeribacter arupi]WKZ94652.1 dTDP-4-dehydrorhamnose 3,5-epimerase family protein [Chimaeribacter arupi]
MSDEINELNKNISIEGLHWVPRWRVNNGKDDSYVVPFSTTFPINVVYHGEHDFKYGQYGIHLGQQDTLTFLGDEKQSILAKFIDCRKNSPTFRKSLMFSIFPSSGKTLIIPPGVAHTFHNLENVFTLNSYKLFLPSVDRLLSSRLTWSPGNDVINIPEDISADDVEGYEPMTEEASDLVYHRIGEFQQENLKKHKFQHSETREFILEDGSQVNVRIREKITEENELVLPVVKISGVEFREIPSIKTGKESCIVPLTRQSPMYIVEHGNDNYDFDSYGLHLGQEDHLTFLGHSAHEITLKLVDMREGSDTLFVEEEITFTPHPNVELVIPCGVAHALVNMARITTINRPVIYLDENKEYIPGHDVIDWPINNKNYLSYKTNTLEADLDYYTFIVSKQKEIVKDAPTHRTPKSIVVYDKETGKHVKVLLKEKV